MAVADGGLVVLLVIAGLIVGMTALLEGNLLARRELAQDVWYDDVTRVSPARRAELIADLRTRTGLEIHRVEVRQIDLIKDAARLVVYYHPV
jgi:hypothetical protein